MRRRGRKPPAPVVARPAAAPATAPARRSRRRLFLLLGVTVVVVGVGLGGWRVWLRVTAPEPPTPDLTGVDPEVAEAIGKAQAAVRDAPRDGKAWGRLGMVLLAHGVQAEARVCFARAEDFDPGDGRWPYFHAELLLAEDRAAALDRLARAAELVADPTPRLRRAEVLLEQGQVEEAEREFQEALRRQPDHPRALLGLGQIAFRRGELEPSRDRLLAAARGAPRVRAVHALLAEVQHRLGDEKAAAEALRTAEGLPDRLEWPGPFAEEVAALKVGVEGRVARADRLMEERRMPEALALLRETAQRYPNSYVPPMALGRYWVRVGNLKAAAEELREAARRKPDATNIHFDLGVLLEHDKQYAAAAESFRAVTKLKPDDPEAYFRLAQCQERQGDGPGAVESLRAAVERDPTVAAWHKQLGQLLARQGRDPEAVEPLRRALDLAPTDDETKRLLEDVRMRAGKKGP